MILKNITSVEELKINDAILINDNSEYNGKIMIINDIKDGIAYAIINSVQNSYHINNDTIKYIQKIN